MRRWIVIVLAGIFLGSIILLSFAFRNVPQQALEIEVAKALLQIGVVAVAGAVVSMLAFEYQR